MSSNNCYYCSLCAQNRPYCVFRELFRHIQYVHNGQLWTSVFYFFYGYKSHVYREHKDLIDENAYKHRIQPDVDIHTNETLLSTIGHVQLDCDNQPYNEDEEQNYSDEEINEDDIINWALLTETINQSAEKRSIWTSSKNIM